MAQPDNYNPLNIFANDDTILGADMDSEYAAIKTTLDQILVNLEILQRDDGRLQNGLVDQDSLSGTLQAEYDALAASLSALGTSEQGDLTALGTSEQGDLTALGASEQAALQAKADQLEAYTDSLIAQAGRTPRGDWATATVYLVDDIVNAGTFMYVCLVDHTSGVFSTDLAASKWMQVIINDPGSTDYVGTTCRPEWTNATTITVKAGVVYSRTSGSKITLSADITKSSAGPWVAGAGNAGSMIATPVWTAGFAATLYPVYIILNPATDAVDVVFGPDWAGGGLPAGYTEWEIIGAVNYESPTDIAHFMHVGNYLTWDMTEYAIRSFDSTVSTSEALYIDGNYSAFNLPPNKCLVDVHINAEIKAPTDTGTEAQVNASSGGLTGAPGILVDKRVFPVDTTKTKQLGGQVTLPLINHRIDVRVAGILSPLVIVTASVRGLYLTGDMG